MTKLVSFLKFANAPKKCVEQLLGLTAHMDVKLGLWTVTLREEHRPGLGEPMAGTKISLECSIHCCPIFQFPLAEQRLYIVTNMCVCVCIYIYIYIYTYPTAQRMCMNYRFYQIAPQWNIFKQIGAVRTVDWIYHWGARLAVTGQICDNGQNVLQILFKKETVAAPVTDTFPSLQHSSRRRVLEI